MGRLNNMLNNFGQSDFVGSPLWCIEDENEDGIDSDFEEQYDYLWDLIGDFPCDPESEEE
jgi:hypothetical protein